MKKKIPLNFESWKVKLTLSKTYMEFMLKHMSGTADTKLKVKELLHILKPELNSLAHSPTMRSTHYWSRQIQQQK